MQNYVFLERHNALSNPVHVGRSDLSLGRLLVLLGLLLLRVGAALLQAALEGERTLAERSAQLELAGVHGSPLEHPLSVLDLTVLPLASHQTTVRTKLIGALAVLFVCQESAAVYVVGLLVGVGAFPLHL